MNVNCHVMCGDRPHAVLASSSSAVRPRRSGGNTTYAKPGTIGNWAHVRPALWVLQRQVFSFVFFIALVALPATVSAAPSLVLGSVGISDRIRPRGQSSSSQSASSSSGITMNVWLPILLVTIVFILFSLCACFRRCAIGSASTTNVNRVGSTPANGNTSNQARPRRRRRTPSQISTKSLPAYMKEPGEQELVLFRGPLDSEDEHAPPHGMATLAETDDEGEHSNATFDVPLDRVETFETMLNPSSTNLMRRVSVSLPRPPELHHATMPHDHRRNGDAHSLDSIGSEAELLAAHQRGISVDDNAVSRGEAPSYSEAVSGMTAISLNDPQPRGGSSNAVSARPSNATDPAGGGEGRSRFSFLLHPFSSHNITPSPASVPSESPAQHVRSGSALSRFSSRESHESHYSRTPSRSTNHTHSRSHSNSNLFRAFRSHSPTMHAAGSSTISLDSISAPLTHTLTRAGFHAPKAGLTPEQIKLITSREALERFGVPYGADAVAAYSLSRERLAEMGPPPDFESVTGEREGTPSGEDGAVEAVVETTAEISDAVQLGLDIGSSGSTLLTPPSSLSPRPDDRVASRVSIAVSSVIVNETDRGSDHGHDGPPEGAQTIQAHENDGANDDDDPRTARPMTPRTARPWGHAGSVVRHP